MARGRNKLNKICKILQLLQLLMSPMRENFHRKKVYLKIRLYINIYILKQNITIFYAHVFK